MKRPAIAALVFLPLLVVVSISGQPTDRDEADVKAPNIGYVDICAGGQTWAIQELNLTALRFLQTKGETLRLTNGAMPSVRVHITPQDTNAMCEFVYVHGYGKPVWRVKFGYDGKIRSYVRRVIL